MEAPRAHSVAGSAAGSLENSSAEEDYLVKELSWQHIGPLSRPSVKGGFGTVFVGNRMVGKNMYVEVAVKVIAYNEVDKADVDNKAINVLLEEARVLEKASSSIVNDFIVKFHGLVTDLPTAEWVDTFQKAGVLPLNYGISGSHGNDAPIIGLVMKYEGGGTLHELIHSITNKWSANTMERLRVLIEIATGLWHLHNNLESCIIHGDIKSANVLLNFDSGVLHIRLADFGLSTATKVTAMERGSRHSTMRQSVEKRGTWPYMAPEMYSWKKTRGCAASRSTDVFSLGVLMHEVLSGNEPWDMYGEADRLAELRSGETLDLDECPIDTPITVRELILKCLSLDRAQRPQIETVRAVLTSAYEVMQSRCYDVFLSYAWGKDAKRKPLANEIFSGLTRNGYNVWMDSNLMDHDMKECMKNGIRDSKVIVVVLTPDYVASRDCMFELRTAQSEEMGKEYIVCMAEKGYWKDWKEVASGRPCIEPAGEVATMLRLNTHLYADYGEAADKDWLDEDTKAREFKLLTNDKALPRLLQLLENKLRPDRSNSNSNSNPSSGVSPSAAANTTLPNPPLTAAVNNSNSAPVMDYSRNCSSAAAAAPLCQASSPISQLSADADRHTSGAHILTHDEEHTLVDNEECANTTQTMFDRWDALYARFSTKHIGGGGGGGDGGRDGEDQNIECGSCGVPFLVPAYMMTSTAGIACPYCKKTMCAECKKEAHPGLTCKQFQEKEFLKYCAAANIKYLQYCPSCNYPWCVPLNCLRVTCHIESINFQGCGMEFCFLCAAPYSQILMHGNSFHRRECDLYGPCCYKNCSEEKLADGTYQSVCAQEVQKYFPGPCAECRNSDSIEVHNGCTHAVAGDWRACFTCRTNDVSQRCMHWCKECEFEKKPCSRPKDNGEVVKCAGAAADAAPAPAAGDRLAVKDGGHDVEPLLALCDEEEEDDDDFDFDFEDDDDTRGSTNSGGSGDGDMPEDFLAATLPCGDSCKESHSSFDDCVKCGRRWGLHASHICPGSSVNAGKRGSFVKGSLPKMPNGADNTACVESCSLMHHRDDWCVKCGRRYAAHENGHRCPAKSAVNGGKRGSFVSGQLPSGQLPGGLKSVVGCDPNCTASHDAKDGCIHCGARYGLHNGHTCPTGTANDGKRGSFIMGPLKGCPSTCRASHESTLICLSCNKRYGLHSGHSCPSNLHGKRGSFPVTAAAAASGSGGAVEAAAAPRCKSGHSMVAGSYTNNTCNGCRRGITCNYRCVECDWDLCPACTTKARAVAGGVPPVAAAAASAGDDNVSNVKRYNIHPKKEVEAEQERLKEGKKGAGGK